MTVNLESFRYPFETEIAHESEGAKIAHRAAFQGILDLNQAIAALKSQQTAAATTSPATENITTPAQTIILASSVIGTVNNQSGVTSYTTQQSDYGAFVLLEDASAIAVTLAGSGSAPGITLPWYANFLNFGAGTATFTPASGTISYPGNLGAASMPLPQGCAANIAYDGTNYWAEAVLVFAQNTPAIAREWLNSYDAATGEFTQTQPSASDLSVGALANGITATTQSNAADASLDVATDAFVQNAVNLTMGTVPLSNITGGTYSFDSQGSGGLLNYTAVGGAILSIIVWIPFVGSGYQVGDVITPAAGNFDAMIVITGVAGAGYPTSGTILYGGTGYVSGTSKAASAAASIQFTFLLSGTLTSDAMFVMTHGTYLTQSNQWIFCNNTTGAFTVTVAMGNASGGVASGRTVVLPQGTNNSSSLFLQGDGKLNVDPVVAIATDSSLGLVEPDGSTITINPSGVISAVGGGGESDFSQVFMLMGA